MTLCSRIFTLWGWGAGWWLVRSMWFLEIQSSMLEGTTLMEILAVDDFHGILLFYILHCLFTL